MLEKLRKDFTENSVLYLLLFVLLSLVYSGRFIYPLISYDDTHLFGSNIDILSSIVYRTQYEMRPVTGVAIALLSLLNLSHGFMLFLFLAAFLISSVSVVNYFSPDENTFNKMLAVALLLLSPYMFMNSTFLNTSLIQNVFVFVLISIFYLMKNKKYIISGLLLVLSLSIYQSLFFLFLTFVVIICFKKMMDKEITNWKELYLFFLPYVVVAVVSIVAYALLNKLVMAIFHFVEPISLSRTKGLPENFGEVIHRIKLSVFNMAEKGLYYYLPFLLPAIILLLVNVKNKILSLLTIAMILFCWYINYSIDILVAGVQKGWSVKHFITHIFSVALLFVSLTYLTKKFYRKFIYGFISIYIFLMLNDLFSAGELYKNYARVTRFLLDSAYKEYVENCPEKDCNLLLVTIAEEPRIYNEFTPQKKPHITIYNYDIWALTLNSDPTLFNFSGYNHIPEINSCTLKDISKYNLPDSVVVKLNNFEKNNIFYPQKASVFKDNNSVIIAL